MNTNGADHMDRITKLALKQFVTALCQNRDCDWRSDSGTPTSQAYVERKGFAASPWSDTPAISAWIISDFDTVTEVSPFERLPVPTIDGMFFDQLIGHWGIATDQNRLSINWQTGPRFGRGFVYPILKSETGTVYLGKSKSTWVS